MRAFRAIQKLLRFGSYLRITDHTSGAGFTMATKPHKTASKKSKSSARKSKVPARKSMTATKPKSAAKAARPAADVQKELAALKARASSIEKNLNSKDTSLAKRAAADWEQFHADLEAWAKKNGTKLVAHVVKHDSSQDPTPRTHHAIGTHGCSGIVGGVLGGKVTVCFFRRYSMLRGECLYACVVTDITT
jgi:hypothetical protein